jgi:F-type H+-transporting ATPase subunit delta
LKPAKQASRYAKALLRNIDLENIPQALLELIAINDLMNASKEFQSLLVSPLFTNDERTNVIRQLTGKLKLSDYIVKFILHLSEVRVIKALPEIIRMATSLYLEKKKKAKAIVMTPLQITKEQENKLRASLKKVTDRELDIEYAIDPSLLGGILVRIGSTMYDTSIKSQLRLLKDELIKG